MNSIIVEVYNQTILQVIELDSFSNNTIKPLRKQLEQVLTEFQDKKEKNNTINSILTCINNNTNKIYEHCKQDGSNESDIDEKDNVETLIDLALSSENLEKLFKDQYGKPYAVVRLGISKQLEILSINSTRFKHYLSNLYRENIGPYIGEGSLNTVITNLASEAEIKGDIIPLYIRVAWGSRPNRSREDCIYYDLCDNQGRIIEISKDGWRIIDGISENIPILFRRYNQLPLIEPDRNYSPDIFDQLLDLTNIKNPKHGHLIKVYIISTLIPEIDHVILTTYGPKGAAKSFLLELIKKIVDPTKPTLLTLNRNLEQFIQQANHNYLNFYDNVKFIPYWLSDEMCKAVTGIGHTKRKLFTDDEDIIYEHRRCLGLNGINVALTESDALDRSLFIELEEIDEERRRKEEDLWREFEKIRPQVLGYILDILSKAMQIKSTLKLEKLPRMADFAEWGEAISQALGYPPMSFLESYRENRNELNIVAVNENSVGYLILRYVQDFERLHGPMNKIQLDLQELYKTLIDFAGNNDISITDHQFPKNAASFVKKLKTIIPNLKAAYGIIIEIGRNTTINTSVITIGRKDSKTVADKDESASGGMEPSEAIDSISHKQENSENYSSTINYKKDTDNSANDDVDKNIGDRNDDH
ncbi:hypothetical protein BH23THE1_BH23THE1_28320 [soil metagenome]